ncbi:MAG: sugar ABC transporter permease, partial [Raoultibacter sp.]
MRDLTLTRSKHGSLKDSERRLGILLIMPAALLICFVIIYPIIFNINMSFYKVALNPKRADEFVGLANYAKLFSDPSFYESLGLTVCYVILTVVGSTGVGLMVALLMNSAFVGRKAARALLLLSYVTPMIATLYVWQYMFNGLYGVVNYFLVNILRVTNTSPLWYDDKLLSIMLVVLYDIWRVFPYAFLMLLASLQAIDHDVYEAADMDGASSLQKFRSITLPALMPTISAIVTLRTIWNFYKFDDVYLFSKKLSVLGVYLYQAAFATHDMGRAAAITIVLFVIVFSFVILFGRKVIRR